MRLSPLALTSIVEEVTPHHRFQLVQTAPDAIDVRLDSGDAQGRGAEWRAAQAALRAYLAQQSLDNVRLHLAAEAPVPDPRSGKFPRGTRRSARDHQRTVVTETRGRLSGRRVVRGREGNARRTTNT